MMRWYTAVLAVMLVFACEADAAGAAGTLRAGAYTIDITPRQLPIITSGGFLAAVAGRLSGTLHARCLVLDDGERAVVIAVVDSLMMPRELLDRVKSVASLRTGIPSDRMLISATHTHSAPPVMGALGTDENPEYARFLEGQIVKTIEGAVANLAPARVGWTVVQAPAHTHCRRWILRPDRMRKDPFGDLTVRANMHPGYENPDFVGPAGPVDAGLSILSVQSPEGQPVALLANYSMHYVGAGGNVVSPDYYGPFADNMQRLVGAGDPDRPFVAMMSQGTSGDQHWMDYSQPRKDMDIGMYADAIAEIVHEAYKTIEYRDWVPLAMAEIRLRLSRRAPSPRRLAWANEIASRMGGERPLNQQEVYAREQVLIAAEPERELKLQALRIGDLGITAIPNEVFAITGLKIKAQSPLQPVFTITLANGADGYVPPPEQHKLGGYATWPARTAGLEENAEPKIIGAVLGLLEQVAGKSRRTVQDGDGRYANLILQAQPLAYWRADEVEGPVARDATRNGNHAGYEGNVAFYLEGVPGISAGKAVNRAPHFAGGRMKAAAGLGDRYTVEMWFQNGLPTDARPVTGYLFSAGAGVEKMGIGGTGRAAGRLFFAASGRVLEGGTPIPLKSWNYVALVRDRTRVAVYLNGSATPEISGEVAPRSARAELYFAGRHDDSANLEGKLDEIAIYDRPLSADEVALHHAAGVN